MIFHFVPLKLPNPQTPLSAIKAPDINETIDLLRDHIDSVYYLRENPDVARAGIDPVLHYVLHGENEGRRPCPEFDPLSYRILKFSLKKFDGNLFWHHLAIERNCFTEKNM
jgi:hypothetical protein